jgi:hypothetical protein
MDANLVGVWDVILIAVYDARWTVLVRLQS